MKNILAIVALLGASAPSLVQAASAPARQSSRQSATHVQLRMDPDTTKRVTTTRTFDAWADDDLEQPSIGKVTVTWTFTGYLGGAAVYEGVIKAPTRDAFAVSLYNIGLQGRLAKVTITRVKGTNVHVAPDGGTWTPLTIPANGYVVERAGNFLPASANPGSANPPNKGDVLLVRFEGGVCEFTVTSQRTLHSPMLHTGEKLRPPFRNGHDTSPPPPEPGGQDGETER